MSQDQPAAVVRPAATRAGFVLLAGLPNAGKSTLLNRLVGEHLSIVTPKAQTTWQNVAGIRTEGETQMVFLDTPGILRGGSLFHRSMAAQAEGAREDADVAVCIVDGARPPDPGGLEALREFFSEVSCPKVLAANKMDEREYDPDRMAEVGRLLGLTVCPISARTGAGVPELLHWIRETLPESPFFYDPDDLATAPTRFFVAELVRETVFEQFHQEVPYASAVKVDEFREGEDPVYIGATIFVERKSQKGILVGKGGSAIKAIGREARRKIEHFLGRRVYLDLWVKVWPGWRRKREGLEGLGYTVPREDGTTEE